MTNDTHCLDVLQAAHDKALADLADMTADYLRRHKDVGDFMEANNALQARVRELEGALQSIANSRELSMEAALVARAALQAGKPDET